MTAIPTAEKTYFGSNLAAWPAGGKPSITHATTNNMPMTPTATSRPLAVEAKLATGPAKPVRSNAPRLRFCAQRSSTRASAIITTRSKMRGNGKWKPSRATATATNGESTRAAANPARNAMTTFAVNDFGMIRNTSSFHRVGLRLQGYLHRARMRRCVDDLHYRRRNVLGAQHGTAIQPFVVR